MIVIVMAERISHKTGNPATRLTPGMKYRRAMHTEAHGSSSEQCPVRLSFQPRTKNQPDQKNETSHP
jgi:hypothetical protein